jgi:hypothetical protein
MVIRDASSRALRCNAFSIVCRTAPASTGDPIRIRLVTPTTPLSLWIAAIAVHDGMASVSRGLDPDRGREGLH